MTTNHLAFIGTGNQQQDDRIGVQDSEGQQQSHHGARSADQHQRKFAEGQRRQVLDKRRADAADHVIGQKAFLPQFILQRTPEHPKSKHVEEDMFEIGMQEHVGDELIDMENGVPSDRAQYSMIVLPAFGSNAVAMKIRTLMIIRFNTTGGVWK